MSLIYNSCKRLILNKKAFKNMEEYLDVFLGGNKITLEEYTELIALLGVEQ